jgi:hypothetical protein
MRLKRMRANFMAKVTESSASPPMFETLYRELQRRVHPDILRSTHPTEADVNDQSLQIVNNLLTCLRESGNTIPDEFGGCLDFHLKPKDGEIKESNDNSDASNALEHVQMFLDTTGKRKIKNSFENFFREADMGDGTGLFEWGQSYMQYPKFEGRRLPRSFRP